MKNNTLKYLGIICFLLFGLDVMAQSTAGASAEGAVDLNFYQRLFGQYLLITSIVVILAAFFAIIYLNNMLMQVQKMRLLQEHGLEVMEKVQLIQKEPWFSRLYKKATKVVPLDKEKEILFEHEYDGIRELDNVLPPWWVALFYASIVFGIGYFGYFHVAGMGMGSREAYDFEMEEAAEAVKAYLAGQAEQVDETNITLSDDESEIALGETIFQEKCAVCHGKLGEGGVGPNLTDQYWLHGGDIKDVFKTIKYGVPEKGMISWKTQLRASDMSRVSSFIMTLVGTNPPNQKEPQGELHQATKKADQDSTSNEMIGLNTYK